VGHDAPLVVVDVAESAAGTLYLLDDPLKPSVRAFVVRVVRATRVAGHHVAIVVASRVVSGMSAVAQAV
jgi:hypothetical protein